MPPLTTMTSYNAALNMQQVGGRDRSSVATSRWWQSLWSRREGRLQDIRRLMVAQLTAVQDGATRDCLEGRINTARHPSELWALRDDLKTALVPAHGELLARQRLTDISFMFSGLLEVSHKANAQAQSITRRSGNISTLGTVTGAEH